MIGGEPEIPSDPLVLPREEELVLGTEVVATQPTDRPVERTDPRHETDRPADHGDDGDLVGAEVFLQHEVARDGPPDHAEDQATPGGRDDVQPAHQAAAGGRKT